MQFSFAAKGNDGQSYAIDFELREDVVADKCKWNAKPAEFLVVTTPSPPSRHCPAAAPVFLVRPSGTMGGAGAAVLYPSYGRRKGYFMLVRPYCNATS